jgi:hypothetical protein
MYPIPVPPYPVFHLPALEAKRSERKAVHDPQSTTECPNTPIKPVKPTENAKN